MNVLECYGVGTVAIDKETDTDEIQILSKGLFPESDGEVVASVEKVQTTSQTPTGDTKSSTTLQGNTISAKWFALNTNRVTAPDVRKGSKVVVYKFKGQDTYRWTYFGMDGTLRLETVVFAFSASPNVDTNTPVTPDNYYMFMVDTRGGKIQLVTGQGNGEKAAYVFELNTKEGQFSVVDSENNIFSINSMEHAFSFINDEKSFLNIMRKNITMSCEDKLLLKATNSIDIQTKDLKLKADNSISVETQTTTWKSPVFNLQGNVTHEGNYNQQGNYTLEGNAAIQGGFSQFGGAGTVSGGWTVDGVNYLGHTHTNGNDGKPTGGVIK